MGRVILVYNIIYVMILISLSTGVPDTTVDNRKILQEQLSFFVLAINTVT